MTFAGRRGLEGERKTSPLVVAIREEKLEKHDPGEKT